MNNKRLAYIDVSPELLFYCLKLLASKYIPKDAELVIMEAVPTAESMKEGVMHGYRMFLCSREFGEHHEGMAVPRIRIHSFHLDEKEIT